MQICAQPLGLTMTVDFTPQLKYPSILSSGLCSNHTTWSWSMLILNDNEVFKSGDSPHSKSLKVKCSLTWGICPSLNLSRTNTSSISYNFLSLLLSPETLVPQTTALKILHGSIIECWHDYIYHASDLPWIDQDTTTTSINTLFRKTALQTWLRRQKEGSADDDDRGQGLN